ncbi:glycosyltransferase family 4 protein [Coralloluteibacterium stylophorae]|uniref:Glycosyltransferase family 1 protein n=1 Tax=Coralloluteibacterium stylophorae TaxID=1776034 RepID=A0A8J7VUM4_9GAMM|nr:glycosyltransferase family 1 protein [Coralloluteibacterium stylophorae]MBS7458689.1 glycosyltransferase family 1 protein [Coralloluteibacterium stylophorae]
MHAAIVTETYPPDVNGVALTVHGLETGLRERGHRVSLVRPRDPQAPADAHTLCVRGLGLPRYPGLRFGLPAGRLLRRAWQDARPDAVYVATEGPLGLSAVSAARALGIPVATGFHTRFDHYLGRYGFGPLAPVARAWMRRMHNRGDATLVPTRALAAELGAAGFRHVVRLARAVDTRQFDPGLRDGALRARWGAGDDAPVVIHVGRIAPEKNLGLAVRAFRAIQAERADARFVFVGDGPEREALERANPDLVFAGVRRGRELARHFASADLFLFPSTTETFGNVTLEAMASGVATVAFDDGAAREYIRNGISGRALPLGDEDGFVAAAAALARDADLRRNLGRAARAAVAELDPQAVAARFEEILAALATARTLGLHLLDRDVPALEMPR